MQEMGDERSKKKLRDLESKYDSARNAAEGDKLSANEIKS
jgi:hypothetical protein